MTALNASSARAIIARIIRNMHVPAYEPVLDGVQPDAKRGVSCELAKSMCIDMSMPPCEEWEDVGEGEGADVCAK